MKTKCLVFSFFVFFLPILLVILIENGFVNKLLQKEGEIPVATTWGPLTENKSIRPCKINVPDSLINDLKQRLKNSRLFSASEGSNFQNGFNPTYMRSLLQYWQTKYDWRKWEKKINSFPQFFAQVSGLDIHFIHIKATPKPGMTVMPLMLIHGWPGSFFEFHEAIPLLLESAAAENIALELVVPSLPGYAWSTPPNSARYPQCGPACTALIFTELMTTQLNHTKFYVQGGDWGSIIAHAMAVYKPDNVFALHTNMFPSPMNDLRHWMRVFAASFLPTNWLLNEQEEKQMLPFSKIMLDVLDMTGYFHLQATRPDTPAFALNDSPMGLAAYILEKFGGFSLKGDVHKNSSDGGLELLYPGRMDELLTNVHIYWFTSAIGSSMRFYKSMVQEAGIYKTSERFHNVLLGVANYPNEILHYPESWVRKFYPNLIQYSNMPRGGHFAAFQVPKDFTDDLVQFLVKTKPFWLEIKKNLINEKINQQNDAKKKKTEDL